jgi:hypothetical protein
LAKEAEDTEEKDDGQVPLHQVLRWSVEQGGRTLDQWVANYEYDDDEHPNADRSRWVDETLMWGFMALYRIQASSSN